MTYDPPKRKKNLRKHAIDLAECEPVFDAPMLTREDTREAYGEQTVSYTHLTLPTIYSV